MVSLRLLRLDAHTLAPSVDPAQLIAASRADVACLFGSPSGLRWRSRCASLGRRSGLVTVTGGRTAGGVLLLSSLGVDVDAVRDEAFGVGLRAPGAALAALRRLGAPFVVAGARLSGGPRAPLRSALDRLTVGVGSRLVCLDDATDRPLGDGYERIAPGVFASVGLGAGAVADGGIVEVQLPDPDR